MLQYVEVKGKEMGSFCNFNNFVTHIYNFGTSKLVKPLWGQ